MDDVVEKILIKNSKRYLTLRQLCDAYAIETNNIEYMVYKDRQPVECLVAAEIYRLQEIKKVRVKQNMVRIK